MHFGLFGGIVFFALGRRQDGNSAWHGPAGGGRTTGQGHEVRLCDRRRFDAAQFEPDEALLGSAGPAERAILQAAVQHPMGRFCVAEGGLRDRAIGLLVKFFHRAKILLPTVTLRHADHLGGVLAEYVGGNVDVVDGREWHSAARVVSCTMSSFESAQPYDWHVIIFPIGEQVLTNHAVCGWKDFHHPFYFPRPHRVYGFNQPGQRNTWATELRMEALTGPVIYESPTILGHQPAVRVVFAAGPWTPAGRSHGHPGGHSAARVAQRGAEQSPGRAGPGLPVRRPGGPVALRRAVERPAVPRGSPAGARVAVLVESPEHGRQLQRLLPDWPLLHAGESNGEGLSDWEKAARTAQRLPDQAIVTLVPRRAVPAVRRGRARHGHRPRQGRPPGGLPADDGQRRAASGPHCGHRRRFRPRRPARHPPAHGTLPCPRFRGGHAVVLADGPAREVGMNHYAAQQRTTVRMSSPNATRTPPCLRCGTQCPFRLVLGYRDFQRTRRDRLDRLAGPTRSAPSPIKLPTLPHNSDEEWAAAVLAATVVAVAITVLVLTIAAALASCAVPPYPKSPRAVAYGASLLFSDPKFPLKKELPMSGLPGRRRAHERLAGAHARQIPAEAHEGTCEDFLRRHEIEARSAALGSHRERQEFARCLARRAADSRNVRLAVEHVATRGGPAPGPNGHRLRELDDRGRWSLARALAATLETGHLEAGPERLVLVPKHHGNGTRPIRLQNQEDRVVQRALSRSPSPSLTRSSATAASATGRAAPGRKRSPRPTG